MKIKVDTNYEHYLYSIDKEDEKYYYIFSACFLRVSKDLKRIEFRLFGSDDWISTVGEDDDATIQLVED